MVFIAKSASPAEWKTVVAAVQTLVEEASFDATVEGITFRAMDPSHVALVDLEWPNTVFEKYDCDKQFRFALRVEDFVKLIRRTDQKDSVEISSADDEQGLLVRLSDGYKREFRLHLIESSQSSTPLPKLSFNAKILVMSDTFSRVLNDVSTVSDHVSIEAKDERVVFSGKSDSGTVSAVLERGHQDLLELSVKEECRGTYSLDYLLNIVKAAGGASKTTVFEYSTKMPLRLEFKLGELGGRIHFYLAPRVEER